MILCCYIGRFLLLNHIFPIYFAVHGTWIDGKQIPSRAPYTVKEGVAIKLGASSRTYKVQWLHHPLPASSNERSITPDSNISNMGRVLSVLECSTKSNEPCTESNQGGPLQPAKPLKSSDSCSDNRKSVCKLDHLFLLLN